MNFFLWFFRRPRRMYWLRDVYRENIFGKEPKS